MPLFAFSKSRPDIVLSFIHYNPPSALFRLSVPFLSVVPFNLIRTKLLFSSASRVSLDGNKHLPTTLIAPTEHKQENQPTYLSTTLIMFSCANYPRGCRGRVNISGGKCPDCVVCSFSTARLCFVFELTCEPSAIEPASSGLVFPLCSAKGLPSCTPIRNPPEFPIQGDDNPRDGIGRCCKTTTESD